MLSRFVTAVLTVVLLWSGFAQPAPAFAGAAEVAVLQQLPADDSPPAESHDDGLIEAASSGSDESVDLQEALLHRVDQPGISRPYSQPARWTPLPHASPDLAGLQRPPSFAGIHA